MNVEVSINDDNINCIEYLENEILAQDIYGQVARKYLDNLQDDMAQQVRIRKGSKIVHLKTPHFKFDFYAKRILNELEKKRS